MNIQAIYEYILNSNLINFLIMVSTLVWIFKRFNLGKIIDSIEDDIKNNIDISTSSLSSALLEYKKARKDYKNIQTKKDEIINSTDKLIEKMNQKTTQDIQRKTDELVVESDKIKEARYEKNKRNTIKDINNAIYTLSFETIKNMINEDIQKKVIENSLNELDEMDLGEYIK